MKRRIIIILLAITMLIGPEQVEAKEKALKPTNKNIILLAKVMYAENGGARSDNTVLLTGIVVCQRVRSKQYSNTIKKVISQRGQYSTWSNGKIKRAKPDERCLELAEAILREKLWREYPKNLVYQSQFKQGKKVFKYFKKDHEYFCLA